MDKRELRLDYFTYKDSYPPEYTVLCEKAVLAVRNSYSVYSHFSVGASVLLDNGEIVSGANQENVAYPSGMCAERTALFYAGSAFPLTGVRAIAIAAWHKGSITEDFTPPCGACRQVMAETIKRHGKDFDVVMIGKKQTIKIKASLLLPFSFKF